MSPLDRKLLRDLWRIKGQAIAIGAVIGVGVLMLVMMTGLVTSLDETRRAYYERYRLADIFAPVTRAPDRLIADLAAIPGVSAAEGRVTGSALIDLPGVDLPLRAQAVSLPDFGEPRLNDVYLSAGRRLDSDRSDEILLLEGFAKAHGLQPGDALSATMNGARRTFRIVGLAQSPEFLYTTAPGELAPDDSRFGVIWMSRTALAAAYDMEGAFNQALLSVGRGDERAAVLDAVDRILDPHGGLGAYGLENHESNRFVSEEISGLRAMSSGVPPIFLGVAAFLLYIVVSRMVQAEREQIGLMKAFGYTNVEVGAHYFKLILAIAAGGALAGCLAGIAAGRALIGVYLEYFKFPFLVFQLDPQAFVIGFGVSVLAASAGGLVVLRGVFALTPATAMRPPAPPDYSRAGRIGRSLNRLLDQPSRMVLRRLTRQPGRMAGAVIGIAAGMALSVGMISILSGFDRTLALTFSVIDRSDVTVTFTEALSENAILELQRMPGVIEVEPVRIVPAVLRNGLKTYRGVINGLVTEPRLNRAVDQDVATIPMRQEGVILATALADILDIAPGETLTVEVREGRQPVLDIPVIGIAETLLGSPAYMELGALNRALREPNRVSGAYLRVDGAQRESVYRQLKDMPTVAGVSLKADARDAFQKLMDTGAGAMRYIMAAIAAIITFGIVYNAARIAYAERARDLASLRVIGFTKGEVAFVLLGELAAVTLVALPVGALLGYYLSFGIAAGFSSDLYQIPAVFTPESYGAAALAVIAAAVASGWLVKRDIDRADLIAALKTRE
ncbi:putative ABC transport system permease protein [Modicisalibacter ilicicola DSM 19980]|uniref:Putative ABC transport system permease protein n=1 Tax=Modicisalibacter ilicicola DSM 19980 TaxID=1121942 RepID=A0A1M4T6I9_9GAMM|nr:ABC transporter permease [Halomonas ilicicola]SHE40152.1 putative ABC transport system permease protein [Halomonas ilicicola DSM 19980]